MSLKTKVVFLLIAAYCLLFCGCSTDFEIMAPAKDVYIVYGILDPNNDVQYVRITKAFQVEGDAIEYAGENDITVPGLTMELVGADHTYHSTTYTNIPREDGVFSNAQTLYGFQTSGNDTLVPGETYELRITKPDEPGFLITAETTVPFEPDLIGLDDEVLLSDGQYSFPTFSFEKVNNVNFERHNGHSFDIRIKLTYQLDGQDTVAYFGPTIPFDRSRRCGNDHSTSPDICYELPENSVLIGLLAQLNSAGSNRSYWDQPKKTLDPDSLNRSLYLEVTAADTFLTNYNITTMPAGYGLNLLIDKKEYTNISGDNIGLFGSINRSRSWIFMSECSVYLLGLSNPAFPPADCEW